ncbi:NAD(P)/FAD-dependent oxidoreductase [Cyanobium sp. NIES-981]|uniref:NAD(P)/FAD-dependent oxidoreductase n=1 Tax=Cyanobium sp. NIES-981 TaxID=1851505 RepID=UPI0007DDC813|nr:geranylgeranyl reductase family protein [Cyanobium sp. NIES-981]SBO42537.1 Geranylgeranyl reductase family protein [Cyanobium sp. NIES-981]
MSSLAGCRPEVIVVGAGAAGAAAAFHLARLGRDVLVLDSATFPRTKPCGGGMAASVQRWFPFDLRPAVDTVIERVRFSWALGDPVLAELPGEAPFWIVRRSRLDAYLIEQAQGVGARLACGMAVEGLETTPGGWSVQVREPGGARLALQAQAVVLADGSGSRLAAPLGLGPRQPRFAATVSVELEGPVLDPAAARFDFGLVRHGFCWAFPRQGGYSIGLGSFVGRDGLEENAVLAELLPSLGFSADAGVRTRGRLRLWNGHYPLHGAGLVVAGDAASLCDPFLAEGLRPALLSGCEAAAAVDRWLGGEPEALAAYSAVMRRVWGDSMAWGRRIAQVFYRVPRVGYQLGIKRPTAPRRIAQILSGELGYGDIAQRVIRRLLLQRS